MGLAHDNTVEQVASAEQSARSTMSLHARQKLGMRRRRSGQNNPIMSELQYYVDLFHRVSQTAGTRVRFITVRMFSTFDGFI